MPTPEPPQKAETTDVPESGRGTSEARGTDPWEKMPEDALNVPDLGEDTGSGTDAVDGSADGDSAGGAGYGDPEKAESPEDTGTADGSGEAPASGSGGWADFLPSPVFVLLLGLTGFAGWLSWRAVEMDWAAEGTSVTPLIPPLLILLGWIVSATVHEYAHALAAYLTGDRSLRGSGYLRLNPFAYRETFAGLILPVVYLVLGGFGLTGPSTYVDWNRIPGRGRRVMVALAGPLASLVLSAALAITVSILVPPGNDSTNWAIASMAFLSFANLAAALVNLLPVPGLDGFEAVTPWLRGKGVATARQNALFGSIAVFALLWFPSLNERFFNLLYNLFDLLLPNPVFPGMVFHGQLLLRFWV